MTKQEMSGLTYSQFESKALELHISARYISLLPLTRGQANTHTDTYTDTHTQIHTQTHTHTHRHSSKK